MITRKMSMKDIQEVELPRLYNSLKKAQSKWLNGTGELKACLDLIDKIYLLREIQSDNNSPELKRMIHNKKLLIDLVKNGSFVRGDKRLRGQINEIQEEIDRIEKLQDKENEKEVEWKED